MSDTTFAVEFRAFSFATETEAKAFEEKLQDVFCAMPEADGVAAVSHVVKVANDDAGGVSFPPEADGDFDTVNKADIAKLRDEMDAKFGIGQGRLTVIDDPKISSECPSQRKEIAMSDDDLIRRGDALKAVDDAYDDSLEPDLADAATRIAALPAAPTFTAADLERAWEMGRDMSADACAEYPRSSPEYHEYIHYDDQIVYSQGCIRALTPPADLAQRVKE